MFSKRGWLVAALAAAVSVAAGRQCQAGYADFEYGTSVTPSPINPGSNPSGFHTQVQPVGVGNGAAPGGPILNAASGTNISVGTITVVDLGTGVPYKDTYGPVAMTFDVNIKDVTSGITQLFVLTGTLTGVVSSDGTTFSSLFNNPFTAESESLAFGATLYTVSIVPNTAFTPPSTPPGQAEFGLPGTYSFNVQASPVPVPEPSALALLGLGGLGMLGLARRRSPRRLRSAPTS